MTSLNKSLIKQNLNDIPYFKSFDHYCDYLKSDVKNLLTGDDIELLCHKMTYDICEDVVTFLLYKKDKYYIFFEIFTGTCSGCFYHCGANDCMLNAIEKCYITESENDIKQYFRKKVGQSYASDISYLN